MMMSSRIWKFNNKIEPKGRVFLYLPYWSKRKQQQQPSPNHRREEREAQDLPLCRPGHRRGQHLHVQDDQNCYLNSLFDHCSQFLRRHVLVLLVLLLVLLTVCQGPPLLHHPHLTPQYLYIFQKWQISNYFSNMSKNHISSSIGLRCVTFAKTDIIGPSLRR